MSYLFQRISLIGLGLLGSSLARVVHARSLAAETIGYDTDSSVCNKVLELGLVTKIASSPEDAVKNSDLVILCVPVGACGEIAALIAPALAAGCIITDVGSVKGAVIADMQPNLPRDVHFIPGHPVAGTEQSGPEAGFASLFERRWCILTPPENCNPEALEKLVKFWQACGSEVEIMASNHHDLVLAITSHLPHLIAYNIVGTAADFEEVTSSEVIKFSAGGFRDFTRIAASDPTMWRDIFLNNREAVLEMLGRFSEDLSVLQRAIRWGDGETLYNLFSRARDIRRNIVAAGQDSAAPNFGRDQKS